MTTDRRPARLRLLTIAAVAAVITVVTGCSAQTEVTSSPAVSDEASFDAAFTALRDCLANRGWETEESASGDGFGISAPEEQLDAYQADRLECAEEVGLNDFSPAPLSPEELAAIYRDELEQADCLRANGVDVPDAPSEQVFVERYTTEDAWYAWRFVGDLPENEWAALNQACPQG